jgi:hypothetical protein
MIKSENTIIKACYPAQELSETKKCETVSLKCYKIEFN